MRFALVLTLAAGLASAVVAQPSGGGNTQPAGQPPAVAPAQPEAPKGIPVPDMPVVKKSEVEGILIEDMKIGEGYEVKPGGAVVAHYHGTLKENGKEFDSSFKRGEPVPFSLSGVIPGWQKGVPGMKVGGIRRLTIPAALAYGSQAMGEDIPANSDLVFVIQLVDALQVEDIKEGTGDPAAGQFFAATAYKMMDKDGKEIEKADASAPYIWLPGEHRGMQFGLEGMKVGGKRKLVIPKEMNVTHPQVPTTRPGDVPLTVEVELVALRNMPMPRR